MLPPAAAVVVPATDLVAAFLVMMVMMMMVDPASVDVAAEAAAVAKTTCSGYTLPRDARGYRANRAASQRESADAWPRPAAAP